MLTAAQGRADGRVVRVVPDWSGETGIVHLVFTTRVGLPPQVRAWIDHLAARLRDPARPTGIAFAR